MNISVVKRILITEKQLIYSFWKRGDDRCQLVNNTQLRQMVCVLEREDFFWLQVNWYNIKQNCGLEEVRTCVRMTAWVTISIPIFIFLYADG